MRTDIAAMNQRLDRMFVALVGALVVIVATLVSDTFFGPYDKKLAGSGLQHLHLGVG